MPAPEMFPRPKPEKAYAPELYERTTYPRQWISANAKRCFADSELRLFQYTADDIFARLRFPDSAAHSAYASAGFRKKRSGGMCVGGIRTAFVKADNGFVFANRIFNGKREPHAFEPVARDLWDAAKGVLHTAPRQPGGRRSPREPKTLL